ncbi:ABC transporter permease [Lactobacillus delbrueckii]|uniref:ABC transporter permease n=1 Tax=Lactobacillus delbrueckii TaxID=1584 RepID=UPI001F160ED2|nr:ABC transporter permease [Lactobacillus delbrueckii]GHN35318.1 ABC-2 transporter family protein [Lactobacillus delbrueckii]
MNPQHFRNISLGLRSIRIVANNEWRAFMHNKGLLLSMFMQPLITYGLLVMALNQNLSSVHYESLILPYKQYALTGVLSFFMTTQMSQAMYRATVDKEYGLLAIKFTNGVQPWHYLTGMSFFPIVGLLFQSAVLIVLGLATGGVYNLGLLLLSLLVLIISLEFWSTLGIVLSTRISSYQQRDIIMTLIFSPVAYAAPTLYVFSNNSPLIIKVLAYINPLSYQLKALRTVAFGIFNINDLLIALALTIIMVQYKNLCK